MNPAGRISLESHLRVPLPYALPSQNRATARSDYDTDISKNEGSGGTPARVGELRSTISNSFPLAARRFWMLGDAPLCRM